MNIIPVPRKIEETGKLITVASAYNYCSIKDTYPRVYAYLSEFSKCDCKAEKEIIFCVDSGLGDEEYMIDFDEDITVISSGEKGAFRACATLKQIFFEKQVTSMKIHDYPMIPNRGFMLDISRGRVPKQELLKEHIRILADMKYNQFQLYLEDIVFDFKHFKEYCNDVISVEEIKELVKYCEDRFIDLIPNQNTLGHMNKWVMIPEIADFAILDENGNPTATINPLDDRSIGFVDALFQDLLPHFNSSYVNLNMDEPRALGTGITEEACNKYGKENVYVDYLNKVIEIVSDKYGRTPMFWDDIIIENEDVVNRIPKDTVVLVWGYEENWPYSGRCSMLNRHGRRFYTCPSTNTYGTITGRFNSSIENIENAVTNCIIHGGEGMLLTEWGDGGHPECSAMSFLGIVYAGACSWNYVTPWPSGIHDRAHLDYDKTCDIIKWCEEYADKFIFGAEGMGRALHMAGNYYLVENRNIFSMTKLRSDILEIIKGGDVRVDVTSLGMVIDYMNSVRTILAGMPGNTRHLDDIILNCDMVIGLSRALIAFSGRKEDRQKAIDEINELKERYIRCWCVANRQRGSQIFADTMAKLALKLQ